MNVATNVEKRNAAVFSANFSVEGIKIALKSDCLFALKKLFQPDGL